MDWKVVVAAPLVAFLVVASANEVVMPSNWSTASNGQGSQAYKMGVDPQVTWQGRRSLSIRSTVPAADVDYGAAIQYVSVYGYEGRRVRFSGMLKTEGITDWAGAFLQVTPLGGERYWGGGVDSEPPRGSGTGPGATDWHPVSVVVDVPSTGTLSMGLVLVGNGQAWLSALRFEEVGPDVPVTTGPIGRDPAKVAQRQAERVRVPATATPRQQPPNLELLP